MKQQILDQLEQFIRFVKSLDDEMNEINWFTPISEGKWSVHEIITHIMKWDEYFNLVTYPSINESSTYGLHEHPDYLGFNKQSIEYGKNKTKNEIVEETINNRLTLIKSLREVEESRYSVVCSGEHGFTLFSYINEFFTSHDKYHIKQIEDHIKKNKGLK